MDLRLRLSLLARMVVALGVLASISAAVTVLLVVVAAAMGVYVGSIVTSGLEAVAGAPRVSTVTPLPAYLVAAAAGFGVVAVAWSWPHVASRTSARWMTQLDEPASVAALGLTLGCLYLAIVEGSATVAWALSTSLGSVVALSGFVLFSVAVTVAGARRRVRSLRAELLEDSVPAEEEHAEVVAAVRRYAQLASVPEPAVRVTHTDRPASFTVGGGENAILVVSSGLLEALSPDERDAVLAHEVSHLANRDSRIMAAALVPVLIVDDWVDDEPTLSRGWLASAFFRLWLRYAQLGVAVLSRGREWAADAGAAALTGSPASLASALRRLDHARRKPTADLREWEASVAALDVLPPVERDLATGPFRTHPPTEERIERLERLERRAERR